MSRISVPRLTLLALFALGSAAAAPAANAAAARWAALGPNGGGVLCLAGDRAGRAVYAGTTGGVFRSVDGGSHWTLLARRIGRQAVSALAVDPVAPSVVYAGTRQEGVWKSRDHGVSWTPAVRGLPSLAVSALAIDPVQPAVIYAGLADRPGPWRSVDGGASWHPADAGLPAERVLSLAVAPPSDALHPGVVYAAFGGAGLFQSADGGATWARLNVDDDSVIRVAAAPDGSAVFAAVPPGQERAALYRSTDGGRSWDAVVLNSSALDFPLAFGAGGVVYTQGLRSADGGAHWTAMATPDGQFVALLAAPSLATTVYGAGGGGLYKTTDGGASWTAASRGLRATEIGAVAVDPRSGAVYISIPGGELLRSRRSPGVEPGAWRPVLAAAAGFIVVDPARPTRLYAGLNGFAREFSQQIAKTTDGGATWRVLPLADPCLALADLAVDPMQPDTLYAGGLPNEGDPSCTDGPPVTYRSLDGGETWRRMPLATLRRVVVDPFAPRTVYALPGNGERGVLRSADGGASWKPAGRGLGAGEVLDLAPDPATPGRLYASHGEGIYASDDGARSWHLLTDRMKGASALRVDPGRPLTLYAGVALVGVFRSLDGGSTWSSLAEGHLAARFAGPLALDPTRPGTLYVGTDGAGLYRVEVAEP